MAAPKVEPKIYTAIVLDFETGGLDPKDCAITQIAMQAVRMDSWELLESYQNYIYPYYQQDHSKRKVLKTRQQLEIQIPMKYEQKALDYTAITMDMLNSRGVELSIVATEVLKFIERNTLSKGAQCKPIIIGQNITFDIGFLQQLITYSGLTKEFAKVLAGTTDFYGNFQPHYLDTITLGRMAFAHRSDITSYKLELFAERLGIELDDAHDAMSDVSATLSIAAVCANRLRQEGGTFTATKAEKTRRHFQI
ncbi:MAG: 3'-5' exonuclease [Rikenellaceae bacterium]